MGGFSAEELAEGFLLDTGCSNHSTYTLDGFIQYTPLQNAKPIKGIGGVCLTPAGVGTLRIHTKGKKLLLSDVYFMPNYRVNLISVGQLEQRKYKWDARVNYREGLLWQIWGVCVNS